ncbi:MAG TPA: serine/threonine-protein kinase [Polyangiales bacterium]|nr:serine/threonine-protein kinase [Polyangiales bacterium]
MSKADSAWRESTPALIGERYHVEKLLGRGGMAAVFQVRDAVSGRVLALKRLLDALAGDGQVARLFEQEFWTLSQLVHPRIIEVYDYQTDEHGPFYTMELLSGGDLRRRSPIGWREVCRLLCDVCSALSLLHSRRFVHRDLTPLNVRCTQDDRAKLFDFGSMACFGRNKHVVGTPPFVAPEALHGQAIDGRTDLYSLGATAYYALTGSHAYPARTLAELPELWRTPPAPPSERVADIPPALDELVLSLLQLSASERCVNAGEVMERLSAIGGCELDEALLVREAYVSTPTLVARAEPLTRVQRQIRRAAEGSGGSVIIGGVEGAGRTRFLDACVLEAKLQSALVLSTAAQAGVDRPWGAAADLLAQLRAQAPELFASTFEPHAHELRVISPDLLPAAGGSEQTTPRAQLQATLRDGLLRVAGQRLLLLAVDDLQRIDEPSAALLALLAHAAREARLMLLVTVPSSAPANAASQALAVIRDASEALHLRELGAEQTLQLVSSVFGEVPNVRLVADRIHATSHGNPRLVMQLAQYLVRERRVHYAAGQWTLPSKLDLAELSAGLTLTLPADLRAEALELARAMVLDGAASRSFDECMSLSGHRDKKRLYGDLHALCAAEVLTADVQGKYRVTRPGWQPVLLHDLDAEHARELHARIAALLSDRPEDEFRMVQHLVRSGQAARALDVMQADLDKNRDKRVNDPVFLFDYIQTLPNDWSLTFHELIASARELGRPRAQRMTLQAALLGYSMLAARLEPEVLKELAAQLAHDVGLDLYESLGDEVPAGERLQRALTGAQQRYEATPENDRGFPLFDALKTLARTTIQGIGTAGRALDYGLLDRLPKLAPLGALSPALQLVHDDVICTLHLLGGRFDEAEKGFQAVLARVEQPDGAGLTGIEHTHVHAAIVQGIAMLDAEMGRVAALSRIDVLDRNPLYAATALRIRAVYALYRGDRNQAEALREQLELYQIQNRPPQILEGADWVQLLFGHAGIGDLLRVKQVLPDVEALAQKLPGWKPVEHCTRGLYQSLRGDHGLAVGEFELALAGATPGRHAIWMWCARAHLWSLVRLQRAEEALERGREYLKQAEAAQLTRVNAELLLPLAEAESVLGHHVEATQRAQDALRGLREAEATGVRVGAAYETRAWVALRSGDAAGFKEYAAACEAEYCLANYSPLLSRYDRLMQGARRAGLIEPEAVVPSNYPGEHDETAAVMSTVLSAAHGPQQRADQALALLVQRTRAQAGCLYLLQHNGPVLVARQGRPDMPHDLDALVAKYIDEELSARDATQTEARTESKSVTSSWTLTETTGIRALPILLNHVANEGSCITGVAVVWLGAPTIKAPGRLVRALSRAFHASGDAVTQIIRA